MSFGFMTKFIMAAPQQHLVLSPSSSRGEQNLSALQWGGPVEGQAGRKHVKLSIVQPNSPHSAVVVKNKQTRQNWQRPWLLHGLKLAEWPLFLKTRNL